MPDPHGELTYAEHVAMDLTSQLYDVVIRGVIGKGPTRDQDCAEFTAQIHAIQHTIMGQSAARAHPDKYRLLGESLR